MRSAVHAISTRRLLFAGLVVSLLSMPACDRLNDYFPNGTAELAPDVEVGALTLRHEPGLDQLGAYYCPQVIDDPWVRLGCAVALGSPPPRSSLFFEFGVVVNMHNPNDIPIPALDVLLALTLFDGVDAEALGAICVSLCGQDDPTCDGQARAGACTADAGDVRSIEDFIARIPNLIHDLATGQLEAELRQGTIAAGGDVQLDLAFQLGIDEALGVFEKTAVTWVQGQLEGEDTALTIPVTTEGTVYFQLPSFGRFGVNFGPFHDTWAILD